MYKRREAAAGFVPTRVGADTRVHWRKIKTESAALIQEKK